MSQAAPAWARSDATNYPHIELDLEDARSGPATPAPRLQLVPLKTLLDQPDVDDVWVWEHRLRIGGVALLAGKPKAGKSTFARAMAAAVAAGSPFCGSQTLKGGVWYLALEEHPDDIRRRFRQLVPEAENDIRFFFGPVERGLLSRLRDEAIRLRPVLIIVDTLQRLAQMSDTNDYAHTTNAMNPLLALARDSGAALLLLHHARKGEAADPQDSIMGSLGITASTDCNLVLSRSATHRTLWSRQRTGPDLDETVLVFDEETGNMSLGGRDAESCRKDVNERILDALAAVDPPGLTEDELFTRVTGKTVDLRRVLRSLVGGLVMREGAGQKGAPYRYARSPVRI